MDSLKNLEVRDYYPAPFWFLNHELERGELALQIGLMHQQGIRSFFMHPRAGLKTPYGSREWFGLMRFIVEEAEKLGMEAWLYDEDPFPSGPAGGRVFMDNPEFAARGLNFHEFEAGAIDVSLGDGRLIEALMVRTDEHGNVLESQDIFDDVGVVRSRFFQCGWRSPYYVHLFGKEEYFHYRAETFYPHLQLKIEVPAGWKVYAVTADTVENSKYGHIPDNLNPDCVRKFIELTHEKYFQCLGDKFGNVVPGIFTDETATGGWFSWTPRLDAEFQQRRGRPLKGNYHRIFRGNSAENRELRLAYWQTVQELFVESFYEPVNRWCKEHGIQLCGHGIGEEDPLAATNGMNMFALQKQVGIPGFDHITPNIPDGKNFKSLNLGGKLVSSAAEQLGEHRVQSECFGCNPYNFGHDGMRKNMHWLYALGVNWLVPHGFHYSYDGFRKDDAGKSFFFQSPDYPEFSKFGEYAAKLGHKLGEARSRTAVCVLFPETVFRMLMPAEMELAREYRERLYECVQFLLDHQIQFELADEETLGAAPVQNGKVRCGTKEYDTLVLPFELERPYLGKFREAGIGIVNDPAELVGRDGFRFYSENAAAATSLMTQFRGDVLYVFNNQSANGIFRIETDKNVYLCNVMNDFYHRLTDKRFALAGYDAVVLELRDDEIKCPEYLLPEIFPVFDFDYMEHPQWDYVPPLPNLHAVLKDWHVTLGGRDYGKCRHALLRDIAGTYEDYPERRKPRPIFDLSPQACRIYPAHAVFTAEFEYHDGALFILAESETIAGEARVLVNGEEIPPFKHARIYDPRNLVSEINDLCRKGTNKLEIIWEAAAEFNGLTGAMYLIR